MSIRREVEALLTAGPLPAEDADEEAVAEVQRLLENISAPVTDEEAQSLVGVFGDGDCYGLSWALLHLIETAPSAQVAKYQNDLGNYWVDLLNARVDAAGASARGSGVRE